MVAKHETSLAVERGGDLTMGKCNDKRNLTGTYVLTEII